MNQTSWWLDWAVRLGGVVYVLVSVLLWLKAERRRRAEEAVMLARLERVEAKAREQGLL